MSKSGDNEPKDGSNFPKLNLQNTRAHLEEANARIEKKAGRNLFFAIGSGLLFGAVFMLTLFLAKPFFVMLVAALIVIASLELVVAFRNNERIVPRTGILIVSVTLVATTYFYGSLGLLLTFIGGAFLLAFWRVVEAFLPFAKASKANIARDTVSGIFVLLYVGFLGSIAVLLIGMTRGEFWVFTLVATVVSVDVGAYVAGLNFGKHKMTPKISPNKTWEGFIGATIFGSAVAIVCSIFLLQQGWLVGLALGITVVLTATLGDLTVSLIKRNLGIKDMSTWMPGHGGFLDRMDSILPSTVPVYGIALIIGVA